VIFATNNRQTGGSLGKNRMEDIIKISLSNHKFIYGVLRKTECTEHLVIFVHGLTGHKNEHIFFNGCKYFSLNGYDSFRFDLYSHLHDVRHFNETTLKIHSNDLSDIIKYFHPKYAKIFLVGHSLGCPIILLSDLSKVAAMIFWEPAQQPNKIFNSATYCFEHDIFSMKSQIDYLISREMVQEAMEFPQIPQLLMKIKIPLKIQLAKRVGEPDMNYIILTRMSPKNSIKSKRPHTILMKLEQKKSCFIIPSIGFKEISCFLTAAWQLIG
jgi:hypothetical protein